MQVLDVEMLWWECEVCHEKRGGMRIPRERICYECLEAEREARRAAERPTLEARLEESGVPWRFRQGWSAVDWSRFAGRAWPADLLARWRPRSEKSQLVLYGGTGTGKTGMAAILAAEKLEEGLTVRWTRSQGFLDAIVADISARRAGDPRADRLAQRALDLELSCRERDVLVLDDVAAGVHMTPSALRRLQDLVAERYDRGVLTIVTTNRHPAELMKTLPSLGSRLLSGVGIHLGDADRRIRQ